MQLPVVHGGPGPRSTPVLARAPGRRRAVPAHPALGRRSRCRAGRAASTRPSAPPTPPTPSTGSRPRPTVRSSPSARARAAPRTPCCASLDADRRAATSARPSPTPEPAAWRGSPTARASSTPAIPRATSTTARVHHHLSARRGRTIPWCGPSTPTPRRGPGHAVAGRRWLLVHVQVGWGAGRRPPAGAGDRAPGRRWSRASRPRRGSTSPPTATSLVGVTTIDAPKGRVVRVALDAAPSSPAGWTTVVAEGEAVSRRAAACGATSSCCVATSQGRRRRASATTPTVARSASSPVSATSIAISGLTTDRSRRTAFVVRRLVRRADVGVARRRRLPRPRRRAPSPATPGVVPDLTVDPRPRTSRSTARRSGCS